MTRRPAVGLAMWVLACAGCGETAFEDKEHPGDPLLLEWTEEERFGRLWAASGEAVGEMQDPHCEIDAQFVVATGSAKIERGKVRRHCAHYPSLSIGGSSGLRAAGAGVVVVNLGDLERNVTVGASFGSPVVLDCVPDFEGAEAASMHSRAEEDDDDEAPSFEIEVERPLPLSIDAPAAEGTPVPMFGEGDLEVRWSGGEPTDGVEILVYAHEAEDDGDGFVRCWTQDDGSHQIHGALLDPLRDDISVLTVSRIGSTRADVEGWQLHAWWSESTSISVWP